MAHVANGGVYAWVADGNQGGAILYRYAVDETLTPAKTVLLLQMKCKYR